MSQRRHGHSRRRTERGAVAVEFALIVPLLIALLSGIVTAGLGYNQVLGVAQGVHEGARFGATTPYTGTWAATVQQQTIDMTYLNVGTSNPITTAMVCADLVTAPSTVVSASSCALAAGARPSIPSGVVAGTCLVRVWVQIPVELTFVLIPKQTIMVTRQSVALFERGTGAGCL